MQTKTTITQADLNQFCGGETCYKGQFSKSFVYTDGVKFLRDNGASWLVIAIESHQTKKLHSNESLKYFQLWELTIAEDNSAVLTCREDSGVEPAIAQEIPFTDFPFDIKLYVEYTSVGNRNVHILLLPSER